LTILNFTNFDLISERTKAGLASIDALAQHASVYAIDLVNMCKSQRVEGLDAGLGATANRIVAIMDALDLAEADIVANSHRGVVALMLAALHPRRVGRLILFAPANPYCRSSDFMARICSTPWGGFLAWMLPYFSSINSAHRSRRDLWRP
jgi:pimeloyl-ACP methyl ester carboxylesterase